MFHLRILAPGGLTAAVLELLLRYPGVAHVAAVPGAAQQPPGDLVEADVVREAADELLAALRALDGGAALAITGEDLVLAQSGAADRAVRQAPGQSADSVVWHQVESHAVDDSSFNGTFLAFLIVATLLAAIGILLDSTITLVGGMVVGPEFGPLAALSVGLVRRRRDLVRRGLRAIGLGFPISMVAAALGSALCRALGVFSGRDLDLSQQTQLISQVGPFSLIVALLAGAAGMLSLTSGKSAALVGVFISVTTVPAAGFVAIAAVFNHWSAAGGAALQLLINLVGIVIAAVATPLVVQWFDRRRASRRAAPEVGASPGIP